MRRWIGLSAVLFLGSTSPAPALAADPKVFEQCAAASEQAQLLKLKGRLVEAKAELVTCSRPACPAVVRKDCDRWLNEVEEATPSIIVAAKEDGGSDLREVKVSIDGKPTLDRLDGRPTSIDPGPHEMLVETKGKEPIKRSIVVKEGEKRRTIDFVFPGVKPPPAALKPAPQPVKTEAPPSQLPTILGWTLVGAGVVGGGLGTFFAIRQASEYGDANDTCAPKCTLDRKDDIDSLRLYSGIAFGVGAAALVSGVILLVTRK